MLKETEWRCPWCGHKGRPLKTAEHPGEANWQWGTGTPADIARNPLMCESCHGVGGKEDWVL